MNDLRLPKEKEHETIGEYLKAHKCPKCGGKLELEPTEGILCLKCRLIWRIEV